MKKCVYCGLSRKFLGLTNESNVVIDIPHNLFEWDEFELFKRDANWAYLYLYYESGPRKMEHEFIISGLVL